MARVTVTDSFVKPTVVGTLTTLVTRSLCSLGGRLVQGLELPPLLFLDPGLWSGGLNRVRRVLRLDPEPGDFRRPLLRSTDFGGIWY